MSVFFLKNHEAADFEQNNKGNRGQSKKKKSGKPEVK